MCTVPLQTDSCFFFLWSLSLFASLSWTLQFLARRALICLICKQRTQWMITRYANTWVWFCTRLGTVENVYDFVSVMRGDGEAYYIYIYTMRTCARSLAHSFTHSHCCLVCSCCRWKNICIIHWFSSGYLHIVAMQSCCQRKLNRPIFTRYYFWIHSINSLLIVTKLALDFGFEYRTKKIWLIPMRMSVLFISDRILIDKIAFCDIFVFRNWIYTFFSLQMELLSYVGPMSGNFFCFALKGLSISSWHFRQHHL